jgi:hypothetical protein
MNIVFHSSLLHHGNTCAVRLLSIRDVTSQGAKEWWKANGTSPYSGWKRDGENALRHKHVDGR